MAPEGELQGGGHWVCGRGGMHGGVLGAGTAGWPCPCHGHPSVACRALVARPGPDAEPSGAGDLCINLALMLSVGRDILLTVCLLITLTFAFLTKQNWIRAWSCPKSGSAPALPRCRRDRISAVRQRQLA